MTLKRILLIKINPPRNRQKANQPQKMSNFCNRCKFKNSNRLKIKLRMVNKLKKLKNSDNLSFHLYQARFHQTFAISIKLPMGSMNFFSINIRLCILQATSMWLIWIKIMNLNKDTTFRSMQ